MSFSATNRINAAESLQNKGKEAYRQKDYNGAYKCFSQALLANPSASSRISILDNRAASLEKLPGRLPDALLDAREMIRLDKKCVRGYLRAGKVLLLMDKPEQAAGIYRYGLRNIHPEDEHRDLLEGMYKKASGKAEKGIEQDDTSRKRVDPLLILPLELMEMVLGHLSFREKMLLHWVSKTWCSFLKGGVRGMYRVLDFSEARKNVKRSTVVRYIERASRGDEVEEVVLNRLVVEGGGEILKLIVNTCRNLKKIRIMSGCLVSGSLVEALQQQHQQQQHIVQRLGPCLESIIVDCETTLTCVTEVLRLCKDLKVLECKNVIWNKSAEVDWPLKFYNIPARSLKRLYLAAPSSMSERIPTFHADIASDKKFFPIDNLEELDLISWSHWLPARNPGRRSDFSTLHLLTRLTISNSGIQTYPHLPPTLKYLEISKCYHLSFDENFVSSSPLPQLEFLNLSHSPHLTNHTLLAILLPSSSFHPPSQQEQQQEQPLSKLKALALSTCPLLNLDSLDFLLDTLDLSNLASLDISGNITFGDQASRELGRMKQLDKMDVSMTKITGVGLLNLVNNVKGRISEVRCVGCEVGSDAVELARAKGVVVRQREASEKSKKEVKHLRTVVYMQ